MNRTQVCLAAEQSTRAEQEFLAGEGPFAEKGGLAGEGAFGGGGAFAGEGGFGGEGAFAGEGGFAGDGAFADVMQSEDGLVEIRQAGGGDRDAMREFLGGLSLRSRYLRFFTGAMSEGPALLGLLTGSRDNIDAVVATDNGTIIGHAMAVDMLGREGGNVVDIGVVVADARQGQGVGSALVRTVIERAQARGTRAVAMEVLAENRQVMTMIAKRWPVARRTHSGAYVTIRADLGDDVAGLGENVADWGEDVASLERDVAGLRGDFAGLGRGVADLEDVVGLGEDAAARLSASGTSKHPSAGAASAVAAATVTPLSATARIPSHTQRSSAAGNPASTSSMTTSNGARTSASASASSARSTGGSSWTGAC